MSGFSRALFSSGPVCFVSKTHFAFPERGLGCMWALSASAGSGLCFCSSSRPGASRGFHHRVWKAVCTPVTFEPWLLWQWKRLTMRGQDRTRGLDQPSGLPQANLSFWGNFISCWMSGVILIIALLLLALESFWFILVVLSKEKALLPLLGICPFLPFFSTPRVWHSRRALTAAAEHAWCGAASKTAHEQASFFAWLWSFTLKMRQCLGKS